MYFPHGAVGWFAICDCNIHFLGITSKLNRAALSYVTDFQKPKQMDNSACISISMRKRLLFNTGYDFSMLGGMPG